MLKAHHMSKEVLTIEGSANDEVRTVAIRGRDDDVAKG